MNKITSIITKHQSNMRKSAESIRNPFYRSRFPQNLRNKKASPLKYLLVKTATTSRIDHIPPSYSFIIYLNDFRLGLVFRLLLKTSILLMLWIGWLWWNWAYAEFWHKTGRLLGKKVKSAKPTTEYAEFRSKFL